MSIRRDVCVKMGAGRGREREREDGRGPGPLSISRRKKKKGKKEKAHGVTDSRRNPRASLMPYRGHTKQHHCLRPRRVIRRKLPSQTGPRRYLRPSRSNSMLTLASCRFARRAKRPYPSISCVSRPRPHMTASTPLSASKQTEFSYFRTYTRVVRCLLRGSTKNAKETLHR